MLKLLLRLIKNLILYTLIIVLSVIIRQFIGFNVVDGESMQPLLSDGDILFGYKVDPEKLTRYDVVTFYDPEDPSQLLVKRVIGLPGDEITLKEDDVYINGEQETLLYHTPTFDEQTTVTHTVPEGHVYVLGDNRHNSRDSRLLGMIPFDTLYFHEIVRLWPLDSVKSL